MEAIKTMAKTSKRVWLKLDGTDVKAALQESLRTEWNGDVDMGDGELEILRQDYKRRIENHTNFIKTTNQHTYSQLFVDVQADVDYLEAAVAKATQIYQRKQQQEQVNNSTLMELCWNCAELNLLLQQAQSMLQIRSPHDLQTFFEQFKHLQYLSGLFKKKRQAATHVLVLLASDEERKQKPYAMPIQYIPYNQIKDQYIRDVTCKAKEEFMAAGVLVVGRLSDSFK